MKNLLKIDLSRYPERFDENSREFSICKNVNFIFGKNGTGKTTIADTIKSQFSDSYNVCVFKDFKGVIDENNRLNAIALGSENAEIQVEIESIDEKIFKIKKEIDEPIDKSENLFTKEEKARRNYEVQEDKIENFYRKSARKINEKNQPRIVSGNKTTYDKNDFRDEIANAKLLSDNEIKNYKEIIASEEKDVIDSVAFSNIDSNKWLKSINKILQTSVSPQQIIDDLKKNIDKQNFAKEGLRIHRHEQGERCAFCGEEISEERWRLLGSYFNVEVKNFEHKIYQVVERIDRELRGINAIKELEKNDFYAKFIDYIININLQIKNAKNEHIIFFEALKSALKSKLKNIFAKADELELIIPKNFDEIENNCNEIIKKNNDFSQNIFNERELAKNVLRYHQIQKELDSFNYDKEKKELEYLKILKGEAQRELADKKEKLDQELEIKNGLILQTKDERKIAEKINKLLKNMGFNSFSLELVNDMDEKRKGQYRIRRWYHNKKEFDDVVNLSKGEKNIIAFLYFLFSLEKASDINKPKIVILDDPMTSNDDTMQYLMISEIQNFYRKLRDDNFFILLTHNCHFYLNVRPNAAVKYKLDGQEISLYEKYGNYCLFSSGERTSIKSIADGKQDFKTNYDLLWKEIQFLYEDDNATGNIMLNPFRKICETYMKFNCIGTDKFFKDNFGIKKLYDVNQHSVDDLEAEQNGKTKDDIKNMLEELFKNNNAIEHFKAYWR